MNKKEIFKQIAGDVSYFDMHEEMMAHNYYRQGAPVAKGAEQVEYDRRVLNAHALLIQYYIDRSFGSHLGDYEFDIQVKVERRRVDAKN